MVVVVRMTTTTVSNRTKNHDYSNRLLKLPPGCQKLVRSVTKPQPDQLVDYIINRSNLYVLVGQVGSME